MNSPSEILIIFCITIVALVAINNAVAKDAIAAVKNVFNQQGNNDSENNIPE